MSATDEIFALIKRERLRRGWTQTTLAKLASTSLFTICYIERGVTNPTLGTLTRVLGALGYDLRLEAVASEERSIPQ